VPSPFCELREAAVHPITGQVRELGRRRRALWKHTGMSAKAPQKGRNGWRVACELKYVDDAGDPDRWKETCDIKGQNGARFLVLSRVFDELASAFKSKAPICRN
jgi:hypothetical protein